MAGVKRIVLRKMSLQMNFVCEVAGGEFDVNPDEHSEGVWAGREEVGGLEMTGEMRVVVENAFRWKEGLGLGIRKVGMGRGGEGFGIVGCTNAILYHLHHQLILYTMISSADGRITL